MLKFRTAKKAIIFWTVSSNLIFALHGKEINLPVWQTIILKEAKTFITDTRKDPFLAFSRETQQFGVVQKIKIPDFNFTDPVIFFRQIDQSFQAYIDDKIIYESPYFNQGYRHFNCICWTMLEIPKDSQGKNLTLLMKSPYKTVGIQNVPILSSKEQILKESILDNFGYKASFALHLCIAIFLVIITLSGYFSLDIIALSIYSLLLSVYYFTSTFEAKLIIDNGILQSNLLLYSICAVFPAFLVCLLRLLPYLPKRMLYSFVIFDIIFLAVVVILQIFSVVAIWEILDSYLYLNLATIAATLLFVLYSVCKDLKRAKSFLFWAVVFVIISALVDNLITLGYISGDAQITPFSTIVLLLAMTVEIAVNEVKVKKELILATEKLSRLRAETLLGRHEAITHLTAGVAHEFNNPLAIIHESITILRDLYRIDPAHPGLERFYEKMLRASKRISNLNQALLELSASKEKIDLELFDLLDAINEITVSENYRIKVSSSPGISYLILASKTLIKKAIVYLLDNALEASDMQTNKVQISIESKDGFIELSIIDQGVGIPDRIKNKIFDLFFSTKAIGTAKGMGLFFAIQYFRINNGELTLKQQANPTIFSVKFRENENFS